MEHKENFVAVSRGCFMLNYRLLVVRFGTPRAAPGIANGALFLQLTALHDSAALQNFGDNAGEAASPIVGEPW
jgi:hypothetical protein